MSKTLNLFLIIILTIFSSEMMAQLSGNYTINSTSTTSGSNFQSFADFRSALSLNGVSGPVNVTVTAGSGPYNEQVTFNNYSGMSRANTVTINGNGERINFNPSQGFADKRIVGFNNGANNFILDSLFITGDLGYGVGLNNNTNHIIVRNCSIRINHGYNWFRGAAIAATNCVSPFVNCTGGSNASNIIIENNVIYGTANGGSYNAIFFPGLSNQRATNNIIRNNNISGFIEHGILTAHQDSLIISSNKISRPIRRLESPNCVGIKYASTIGSSDILIEKNEIFNLHGGELFRNQDPAYGIYIEGGGKVNDLLLVENNIIYKQHQTRGSLFGIYLNTSNSTRVANNSISFDNQTVYGNTQTTGIYSTTASNLTIVNNSIFVSRNNTGTNYGLQFSDSLTNSLIDFNNVFLNSNSANNVYGKIGSNNYDSLIHWQNVYGQNSRAVEPFYISSTDLTPRSEFLNNTGLNIGLQDDIYSQPRDTAPDIGAIEFGCGVPEMSFNSLNDTTVQISLLGIGDTSRFWQIEYDTLSFTAGAGNNLTTISSLDTLNHLIFNKIYQVYIRSICNTIDTGSWSNFYTFSTIGIPMAGIYTVDSSQVTMGNNFQSFVDLTNRLAIVGVSDSVQVNVVANTGPYNQQVVFENINGLSSNSPLIINGNGETIAYSPTNADKRIIGFDNVSYITLDSFNIQNLHPNYGFNVHLKGNSNYITVKNSVIDYSSITQPYNNSLGVLASNSISTASAGNSSTASYFLLQNNHIKGNVINGVFSAVYLHGGTGSSNNIIEGNVIEHFIENGIIVSNQTNLTISGNKVANNKNSYPTLVGINVSGANCKNVTIERNLIENLNISNTMWGHYACGIELVSNNSSELEPIVVKNNIIRNIKSDRTHSGIRINGSGSFKVYHNTLYLVDSVNNTGDLHGIYNANSANNTEVYNNIISLDKRGTGVSYIYLLSGYTNQIKARHNAYYFNTLGTGAKYIATTQVPGQSIYRYTNLATWQNSGSGIETNSIFERPSFFSDSVLRPLNTVLKSGGVNVGVRSDYYGITRDSQPDIGAVKLDTTNYPYYPINQITTTNTFGLADSIAVFCITSGTVNSIDLDGDDGLDFYIGTQLNGKQFGLNILASNKVSNYRVGVNDSLLVTGQVTQMNGQISFIPIDIEIIADSVETIHPNRVNTMTDSIESTLVTLSNLKLLTANDTADYLLSTINGNGDTTFIYIDADTDVNDSLNIAGFAIGDSICDITGIVTQYDTIAPFISGYRLIPIYFSQIDTISCVITEYDLAQKDTLRFDLSNCSDSVFFKYAIQNNSNKAMPWQVLPLSDTIVDTFENELSMYWNKSVGVTFDSICGTANGSVALTFGGKSGKRFLESHPMNLACYNSVQLSVKKANNCNTATYSNRHSLLLQHSVNDGITWVNLQSFSASGIFNVNLPTAKNDGLLNLRMVQLNSTDSTSQIWIIDDFKIEPNSLCTETINNLFSQGDIAAKSTFNLSGYISTLNKDSGTVFTTLPIYINNPLTKVHYLTIQLNYNKNICPEFDVQELGCGGSRQFTNTSTGNNLNYLWDFGDGDTSTLASPNHFYEKNGVYSVKLVACDSIGCDSISRELVISNIFGPLSPACQDAPNFVGSTNFYIYYLKIGPDTIFTRGNGWESFDNYTCETQTLLNVGKIYTIKGSGAGTGSYSKIRYHVWIDYNNDGFLEASERIMATNNGTSGQVNFVVPNTAVKDIPLRLKLYAFVTTNSFPNNYAVDCNSPFTDLYRMSRDYTVILTDSVQKPAAGFNYNYSKCGNEVSFNDSSLYHPSSYLWNFGDGKTSNLAVVEHTYENPGTYQVQLIVENKLGKDSITKIIVIQPQQAPSISGKLIPHCALEFLIQDSSKYKSVSWSFGNGDIASGTLINYPYIQGGIYPIELTKIDTVDCVSIYKDTLAIMNLGDTAVVCDSYTWIDGITYTESTSTAQYVFANDPFGCDSIITLNLTVNNSSIQFDTILACDQYIWPLNGNTYTSSGIYQDTIPTVSGCDSIGILNLTINNSTSLSDTIVHCDSYQWSQTGLTYYKTGIFIDTLVNSIGCDSLRILDLTINSTLTIDTLTVLDSMVWLQTGVKYYTSGFYSDTLNNRFGCDSILAIQLKINSSDAPSIEFTQSKETITFSNCNSDSSSFELTLNNTGDTDTLFWSIEEEVDNGLYFDNFENGFKSTLWQTTNSNSTTDTCGSIFGNGSLRFSGNSWDWYVETFPINTSNADTLHFSYKNNSSCDSLILNGLLRIYYKANNQNWNWYNITNIRHSDSVIHVSIPIPTNAKTQNVSFKIEQRVNYSTYPYYSDITIDNFRIDGNAKEIFTPLETTIKSGYILPGDSQNVMVNINRSSLESGWQHPKLYIHSNDSLNPLDSINLSILLNNTPCSDFSTQISGCNSSVQFTDLSRGKPTSWYWDFGDSSYSTIQNPTHSFNQQRMYTVTLITCTYFGCDTMTKSVNGNFIRKPEEISCDVNRSSWFTSGITNVTFGTINNTSGSVPYEDFTCIQARVQKYATDTIRISTYNSQMSVYVFIDFNNNAIFETTEKVLFSGQNINHSAAITIDSNAVVNVPLRMRVGSSRFGGQNTLNGCNTTQYVEYEDYTIIVEDSSKAPSAILAHKVLDNCSHLFAFKDSSLNYPNSWLWDFGDGNTSNVQNPIYSYTQAGTYQVSLTVNNANGIDSVSVLVKLNDYTTSDSIAVTSCISYTSPSGKFIWNSSGVFVDSLQNSYGCDSIITINLTIDSVDVSVLDNSPTLIGNMANASYRWLDCNQNHAAIVGETNQSYLAMQNGSYAVEITDNNCVDTSQCIQVLNVGLNESSSAGLIFTVSPNPNNGEFVIKTSKLKGKTENLTIMNEVGQVLSNRVIHSPTQKINLEELSNGIYYLMYRNRVEKIIVIR